MNLTPSRNAQGKGHSRTQSNQRLLPSSSHLVEEVGNDEELVGGEYVGQVRQATISHDPRPTTKRTPPSQRARLPPGCSARQAGSKKSKAVRSGNEYDGGCECCITSFLDTRLVGRTDPADFSEAWRKKFSQHPSWCDADMCLQQIKLGNATGNQAALYARSLFQRSLYGLGCFVQRRPYSILSVGLVILVLCCFGLRHVSIETDLEKLWVAADGRLNEELRYFSTIQNSLQQNNLSKWGIGMDAKHFVVEEDDAKLRQLPEDESSVSGYQVLIQTVGEGRDNLLTKQGLLTHTRLMEEIVGLKVEKFGRSWTLADICFKPGGLDITNDSIAYEIKPALERLIPCIWITPIDCFWEGSKPIGPNPPLKLREIPMGDLLRVAIPDLPAKASWANINPRNIVENVHSVFALGTIKEFFIRTGIEEGYLDRPCIDPLDRHCPTKAPNYYSKACEAMQHLEKHLATKNMSLAVALSPYMHKDAESNEESSLFEILSLFSPSSQPSTKSSSTPEGKRCDDNRKAFLAWVQANLELPQWRNFFPKRLLPIYPDYGDVMRHGCNGFAKGILNWPVDMILGGVSYQSDRTPSFRAEALQSVLLVSTPTDVYKRLKEIYPTAGWSPLQAKEIVSAWQRRFADFIYNHELNFLLDTEGNKVEERRIAHPLAASSISDMLAEFCDFNYMVIFAGYMLMLLYAMYSQLRWDGFCLLSVNSAIGLAFAGVLTVTLASVAGLGTSTWFHINFNAATTQIVPFLALGIGVDNMFLLLHNYPQVIANVQRNEIGVLLKETGMSILMTSSNNILSFLAGTVLPIPALRSFCAQTSILLSFNLLAILTIYPALIALDLRRRKKGKRDICCCFSSDDATESNDRPYGFDLSTPALTPAQDLLKSTAFQEPSYHGLRSAGRDDDEEELDEVQPYTLRAFLNNYYIPLISHSGVKVLVIALCLGLFVGGLAGIRSSSMGLELSDVLPKHTAPAAFLQARDKYFSFYPMNLVLKDVDLSKHQHDIRRLREEVGRSSFVGKLKSGEPSERYWLGMFTEWVEGMQKRLDDAERDGIRLADYDTNNSTAKSPDLDIAYSLACSFGEHYDCSRVGRVRLIDEDGTVNREGFYNYLYGWVEYESMLYAVSQASFYPKFHKLRQGNPDRKYRFFIPPAPRPLHSKIPFYLTGLRDTASIVAMIREVRGISDKYTALGVLNYPQGIAFTFWEQYLDLNTNLVKAIAIISLCIFCVISVLLFNPWAACCILSIILVMTVELAGFLAYCGIKFNPITVVSLISAMGIGVEFTAHVVFAFLTALGTRNERMASAVDQVFVPVIHGALSTLLGILMLGFSQFEFVFKYFFVVMTALILIGLINGLALLPVLLSILGPTCEVRTKGVLKRLAPPPPSAQENGKTRNIPLDECERGEREKGGGTGVIKASAAESKSTEAKKYIVRI